jgi:hypothetical protein
MNDPANNDYCDVEQKLADARERMTALLNHVAIRQQKCHACEAIMLMVPHANGRLTPYDADGTNHFATCSDPNRFRKGKRATTTADN